MDGMMGEQAVFKMLCGAIGLPLRQGEEWVEVVVSVVGTENGARLPSDSGFVRVKLMSKR